MGKFLVVWEIDIDDPEVITHEEAAKRAWRLRNTKGSIANVFNVTEKNTGVKKQIDLYLKLEKDIPNA